MTLTKNWSGYRSLSRKEQDLFQELYYKTHDRGVYVKALLVSTNKEKDYTEYIFLYNDPDIDNTDLESFYALVDNKNETLMIEHAKAKLTKKMILRNVKAIYKDSKKSRSKSKLKVAIDNSDM